MVWPLECDGFRGHGFSVAGFGWEKIAYRAVSVVLSGLCGRFCSVGCVVHGVDGGEEVAAA